jgi:hypothetical protein
MPPKIVCTGEGVDGDHCCYVFGNECEYLRRDADGRKFACALMIQYKGNRKRMIESSEYKPIGDGWVERSKGTLPFDYCTKFSAIFCCRRDLNPGFANDTEAWEAGFFD